MPTVIVRGPEQKAHLIRLVEGLGFAPTMQVEIKRFVAKRSLPQNALLHKWFGIIADETGDTADGVKEDLKRMFLQMVERESRITGEVVMEPKRTRDLSKEEMRDFMTRIEAWAATWGIALPHPEDLMEQ